MMLMLVQTLRCMRMDCAAMHSADAEHRPLPSHFILATFWCNVASASSTSFR